MRVKITTDRRPFTPKGRAEKGDIVDVTAAEAQVLIDNGFAEKLTPKKSAEK